MQPYTIRTHNTGTTYDQPHFFILSRGKNSGRPMKAPCANCFVFLVADPEALNQHYWMMSALFRAKAYEVYMRGSVIMFVTLHDMRKIIALHHANFIQRPEQLASLTKQLQATDQLEANLRERLELLRQLKAAMLQQFIRADG